MNKTITTPCGSIKGIDSSIKDVLAFKGIRYATAKRFEKPIEVTSWEGTYNATKYGNCCYQPRSFYNEEENIKKIFYYNEFRKNQKYTYSEDCLFLNIWTHKKATEDSNLPVLVYIHGGGYTGGCGHELHFDDPIWPLKGVIAVTINYRLGPLGFTVIEPSSNEKPIDGNFGLYDQITALKWIKNNIKAFGGNPNDITIMGQSAGAMSIQQLCLSPLTKGLFTKAIMSSGGGINKFLPTPRKEKRYEHYKLMMDFAGCKTINELKELPIEQLFEAWTKARKKFMGMATCPVIDNELIVDDAVNIVKKNEYHKIPYLIGSNSEDMLPPFMSKMAIKWCKKQGINSYCYMFNHQLPGDKNGAWHSSDLWYFFGTLKNCWRPTTDIDAKLTDTMTDYLTNFVKTGNPNNENLPVWQPTTKRQSKVMHFGNNQIKMKKVNSHKLWWNMFTKKAVGE